MIFAWPVFYFLIDALEWLEQKVTQKDAVVVFIAVHGKNDRGNYYVLPSDVEPVSLRSTAVNFRLSPSFLSWQTRQKPF